MSSTPSALILIRPFSHLPVRSLLFQCSICHHGGHKSCYRRYYMETAMVELPATSFLPPSPTEEDRGRSLSRQLAVRSEDGDSTSVASTRTSTSIVATSVASTQGSGGQSPARTETDSNVPMKMLGHPCATGCGHYCWAVNVTHDVLDL